MKTMICLILDRSGSMSGREADVIGGVNTFIAEQQKNPDPAHIALVRFDLTDGGANIERFRPMQPLKNMKPMTDDDFQPRGGTPLLDAIGRTLNQLDKDWAELRPERCICVVVTDGAENSSIEFKKNKIKEMIQSREKSGLWSFVYLGANVDAFGEAGAMGFMASNTANYANTSRGVGSTYTVLSSKVSHYRSTGQTVSNHLGGDIQEDGTVTKSRILPDITAGPAPQAMTTGAGSWTPPA